MRRGAVAAGCDHVTMSAGRQPRQRFQGCPDPDPRRGSPRAWRTRRAPRDLTLSLAVAVLQLALSLLAPERTEGLSSGVALLCSRVAGLSPRQRALCRSSPDAVVAVGSGLRLALQECQHQFRHERWNCSAPSAPSAPRHHHHSLPLLVRVASREAAFSLAVQAAAISWAAAAACARGELSGCSCARKASPRASPGASPGQAGLGHSGVEAHTTSAASAFRWGGCSSDVDYGAKLSRTFTDGAHHDDDGPRMLMDSHNSKAGRKAVKLTLQTDCKCHGVSGSCSVRTCWTSLAPFRAVGDHLMSRYRAAWPAVALPVTSSPTSPTSPTPARARRHPLGLRLAVRSARNSRGTASHHAASASSSTLPRVPRRTDLVFLQGSPSYCERDVASGSLGTAGRTCNRTSRGADGCGVMCCGRGYNTRQVTTSKQCHCKFHWCCYVLCDVCTDHYEEYTCK